MQYCCNIVLGELFKYKINKQKGLRKLKGIKKIISIILAATVGAGITVMPIYADEVSQMTVSAPRYCRIEAESAVDGYDATREFEAPVNGQFKDIVTWGAEDNYGTVEGTYKCEVDIEGGSGESVKLLAAVYDESGKLARVAVDEKAAASASDTLSVTAEVGATDTYKSFIWGNDGVKPLETEAAAPTIRYFYCDDPGTVTLAWYNEGGSYSLYKNGTQVDISGLTPVSAESYKNMGKYPAYIYTDTAAADGDTYVVKNGTVSSEALVASFSDGASVTLGKYVSGRNMSYMRNDNAVWWHNSVSDHKIIEGVECDVRAYKSFYANNKNNQKWTNFYFKVDQDYISGSGNTVDVTINYFDYGTEPLWLYYYPDSDTSNTTRVSVATTENTNTWKTVTHRLTGVTFAADTGLDDDCQLMITSATGSAISGISVEPYYDTSVQTLRAANTYSDGIELRWTTASSAGITGYTVKRNGTTIATNYQKRVYYDRNLNEDTQYSYTVTPETAGGLGTESSVLTTRTQVAPAEPLSMTLPLASGYESNTASTSNSETATSQQYSDGSGLTFGFYTNDRWNEGMTLARQKAGKWCRTTLARNTSSNGSGWYEIYDWGSNIKPNLKSTFMSFKVDNSKISADTRNVTIEFDYFDNTDSALSGQYVELTYLATDSQKKTVRVAYTRTGEWKTARFDITDAQFDHRSSGALQGGYTYDFRIGSGGNRGGFASSWIKVYPTALEELNAGLNGPMPEHETYGEVNADGTALTGDVVLSIWDGSYDRDIGFSGKDGRAAVNGKHYIYNREYAKYNESGQGWKRWKNAFCVNVPDDFLYGTDYEKVEIEVECYLTAGSIQFNFGGNDNITNNVPYNEWTTTKVVIDPSSGRSFSNGVDGVDFKIFSTGCEGYIHKITVRKDIIED